MQRRSASSLQQRVWPPKRRNPLRPEHVQGEWAREVAPRRGFEPRTPRLTAACSTVELSGIDLSFPAPQRRCNTRKPGALDTACAPPTMSGPVVNRHSLRARAPKEASMAELKDAAEQFA